MEDILHCYKVLDLEPGVSAESVRRSYLELAHVWDPGRYTNDSVLRRRAEQKRKEIEDAYQALQAFLPELQGNQDPVEEESRPERDYNELSTGLPMNRSQTVMGIVVGIVLFFMFVWAYVVLIKGRHVTPSALPVE